MALRHIKQYISTWVTLILFRVPPEDLDWPDLVDMTWAYVGMIVLGYLMYIRWI